MVICYTIDSKRFYSVLLLFLVFNIGYAQTIVKRHYFNAFNEQLSMLNGESTLDFKRAVFITENVYYGGTLDYEAFKNNISDTGNKLKTFIKYLGLSEYKTAGNWAVFTFMMDSIFINNYLPFTYDFDDFMGENDWTKMFITKLIRTKTGNCHSLPYYYKILCEEVGVEAYLALAPNHIYIKHIDENGQWVNVELTSGGFPRDQWIINSMAISVESIKNEVYMNPLNSKESIALTVLDLACGYEFLIGKDNFYLSMIDTALAYFPKCVPLLICKANYYRDLRQSEQKRINSNYNLIEELYFKQENLYGQINRLGHKEIPLKLYKEWVRLVEKRKQIRNNNN